VAAIKVNINLLLIFRLSNLNYDILLTLKAIA